MPRPAFQGIIPASFSANLTDRSISTPHNFVPDTLKTSFLNTVIAQVAIVPMLGTRRYTQVSVGRRRSGRDAGTQTQGSVKSPKLPSMALDTGIHAGMTTLKHTCV